MKAIQTAAWYFGIIIAAGTFLFTVYILLDDPPAAMATHHSALSIVTAQYSAGSVTPPSAEPSSLIKSVGQLSNWFRYIAGWAMASLVLILIGYGHFGHPD